MNTEQVTTTFDDVRLAILRQHTSLSQLLDELEGHANEAILGNVEGTALRKGISLLEARLNHHLEYEEAHLVDWLPRTGELLQHHAEQRDRMRGLRHDSAVFGDSRTVAREVLAFVHSLRKDILQENALLNGLPR